MSDDWEEQKQQAQSPFHNEFVADTNKEPRTVGQDSQAQKSLTEDEKSLRALLHEAERDLGEKHPVLAYPLVALGDKYSEMSREAEAEQFYKRAITIWEQHDPNNLRIAQPLNNLGVLYTKQDRYAEAEPLIERALQIEEQYGQKSERLHPPLSSLTYVYLFQIKLEQAEATYQRLNEIGYPFTKLTHISFDENPYQVAEAAYQQALKEHNLENWQETKRHMQSTVEINQPAQQPSVPEPERDRDIEPDL